jgi:NADH-quinone oxidoreductase subunit J
MLGPDVSWYLAVSAMLFSIGALGVLLRRSPLIVLLSAEFVAAAQVLVYAGAVMVMFLFVIAYLGGEADAPFAGRHQWQTVGAIAAAAAILVEIVVAIGTKGGGRLSHEADIPSTFGSPAQIGRLFLTDHLLAFEVTSIVLLAAAVGGVVLGHHSQKRDAGP